jgi:hypothetical protein
MPHKYFYLSRPPSYAHQPDGFSNRDGGCPSRNWPTAQGGQCWCFGFVEYPEPLPFAEVNHWDLLPDDPVEWAHYEFWQYANRDAEDATFFENDHIEYLLAGDMDTDHNLYAPTKILADARKS